MTVEDNVRLQNLAGIYANKTDGNLVAEATASAPRQLIIGTAGKGPGGCVERRLFRSISRAKSIYGSEGTLLRGMYEGKAQKGKEFLFYRIGCRKAKVEHIGDTTGAVGYTVETYMCDADAGTTYCIWYDDTEDRLVVTNLTTERTVYDNDPDVPIDLGEVVVSGYRRNPAGGPDIGSASGCITMEDVKAPAYTGCTYTAGTDGLSLSRMEMWEEMYKAYKILVEEEFSVATPMDIYLDDYNIVDQGHKLGSVPPIIPAGSTYPTAGAYKSILDIDSLGKVYVEEYQGEYHFWWDIDADGTAEIFPSTGSADATHGIDGTVLELTDFHEVNFGYQLGRFLYDCSVNYNDCTGVIGVQSPESNLAKDKALWVGTAPLLTLNSITGEYTVTTNGTGLLGNKFMAGMVGYRSALPGGGFILTDCEFLDSGSEVLDENDVPIDLGKFFNVMTDWTLLSNSYQSSNYVTSFATSYGGFYVEMPLTQGTTNQTVSSAYMYFRIKATELDKLVAAGYTTLRLKPKGLVVAKGLTAALATSDYTFLSTTRIVQEVVNAIREEVDPFLGKLMTDAQSKAAHVAAEGVLLKAKKGMIRGYKPFEFFQTAAMRIAGEAIIDLTIYPAFELCSVTVNISLAAK